MAFVFTNEGEKMLLERSVGKVAAGSLKLKLFTNDYTPVHDDVVADYTEMGAVQGYTEKTLTTAGWNAATAGTGVGTSLSNKAQITYPQQQWTFDGTGGSVTVYGYFITDDGETVLLGAERFTSSQLVSSSGDLIKVTPGLTGATE